VAARIAFYVNNGPAAETQRARATAMRQWIRVFLVLGHSYLMTDSVPADAKLHMGATFAAFMADCGAGVTADTIVGYLSHVRMWHIEHGHPDPWPTGLPLGQRVLLGVRRVGKAPRGPRKAITPPVLRALLATSIFSRRRAGGSALAAMSLLAFFAMLRRSEYLSDGTFDPATDLTIGDFRFEFAPDGTPIRVIVTIKLSKTDQYANGTEVVVGLGFDGLCCVSVLYDYFQRWRRGASPAAPAFTATDGSPATYEFLATGLRAALTEAGIDPSLYASHSFRSGGATAAAAEGVPEYLIKLQGRWASCVFLRYVRKDKRTLADMAAVMGRAEPDILRHGTTKRAFLSTA
jgi:hypothetical protein